jgi:hypothetical protein
MALMPWNQTDVVTEKEQFVMLARTSRFTITDLCADFDISRKAGHKYLQRYQCDGRAGLDERSKYTTRGPKKIHNRLLTIHDLDNRPHINTINNILNRHGLTKKRKRRTGLHRVRPEHLTLMCPEKTIHEILYERESKHEKAALHV